MSSERATAMSVHLSFLAELERLPRVDSRVRAAELGRCRPTFLQRRWITEEDYLTHLMVPVLDSEQEVEVEIDHDAAVAAAREASKHHAAEHVQHVGRSRSWKTDSRAPRSSVSSAAGRPVFVNMTAAWCVSCLVNERVALSRAPVQAAGNGAPRGEGTKVDGKDQRARDSDARAILEAELKREEEALAALKTFTAA